MNRVDAEGVRLNAFVRSVYARLSAGALAAWIGAWIVAVLAPVRQAVFLFNGQSVRGVTLVGALVAAAPVVLWMISRTLVRAPRPLRGAALYWTFAFFLGAGANLISQAATAPSVASLFLVAALCFAALNLTTRLIGTGANFVASFLVVMFVGEGAAALIDRIATPSPLASAEAFAIAALAAGAACAAPAVNQIWREYHAQTPWNALVDFAAMRAATLTPALAAPVGAATPTRQREAPAAAAGLVRTGAQNAERSTPTLTFEDQT